MKKLSILFLGLFFLTSCEKEDILPTPIAPNPQNPIVKVDPFAALPKETAIPDSNFEKVLIEKGLDLILDGKVTTSNVCYLSEFKLIDSKNIQSIKGIESFISLNKLWIEHQLLKDIDITKNINLTLLSLWDNPLTQIDLSKNTKLTILGLSEVNMSTIDLSNNVDLEEIAFQNGEGKGYGTTKGFTSLDLTHNVNLKRVYVWKNRITELDLTMCPKLSDIWFSDNPQMTSLKLAPTQNLKMVIGWNTGLESLDLKGSLPYSIATQNSPKLKSIRITNLMWINTAVANNPSAYTKDSHTMYVE